VTQTREIILEKAGALFYAQGFNNTGMEQITKVCGIKKPSLYYHFESKNALGLAYLEYRATILFAILESLMQRAKTFDQYLSSWATALMMLARRNEFFGCPFTAFSSELDAGEREFFDVRLRALEKEWLAIQEKAFVKFYGESAASKEIAEKILIVHTGCVMLYRASRDMKYLRRLKNEFSELAIRQNN
jgi:TetR/AcrR family transcriptional regulator, transcriptional repressor for nem operon